MELYYTLNYSYHKIYTAHGVGGSVVVLVVVGVGSMGHILFIEITMVFGG